MSRPSPCQTCLPAPVSCGHLGRLPPGHVYLAGKWVENSGTWDYALGSSTFHSRALFKILAHPSLRFVPFWSRGGRLWPWHVLQPNHPAGSLPHSLTTTFICSSYAGLRSVTLDGYFGTWKQQLAWAIPVHSYI